jgi:hypothetical protein
MAASQWLPGAIRVPGESSGRSEGGGAGIVHHTTEGASAGGAVEAYRATRSWPTLTAEWTGVRLVVFQHMPLNLMARALEHPSGPATNRANKTQIEHVGFTDDAWRRKVGADPGLHVSRWPDARWAAIGALCRQIEAVTGCPAISAPPLTWWDEPQRMSGQSFFDTPGHSGHVHVPGNHHTDGTGFEIVKVLSRDDRPARSLKRGDTGPDVLALQLAVRLRAARCGRKDHMPVPDGIYGPKTERDAVFVAYVLGLGESQDGLANGGLSEYAQARIRDPRLRNRTQLKRAAVRRAKHCKGA